MKYPLFNLDQKLLEKYVETKDNLKIVNFEPDKARLHAGDCRDGTLYVYDDNIIETINIAMATKRPILVRGLTGCGKSSLAYNMSRVLNRRYYELVVTSKTRAKTIMWYFDAVKRLSDTQIPWQRKKVKDIRNYIIPGILWWVFNRDKAIELRTEKGDPAKWPLDNKKIKTKGSIILIDEIDKADPDVPNNLLVPLGSYEFNVEEIDYQEHIKLKDISENTVPIIIITTNNERTLPDAFIRRCIILDIPSPGKQQLLNIASSNFGKENLKDFKFVFDVMNNRKDKKISTAEYLDTVKAFLTLNEDRQKDLEKIILRTAWKKS